MPTKEAVRQHALIEGRALLENSVEQLITRAVNLRVSDAITVFLWEGRYKLTSQEKNEIRREVMDELKEEIRRKAK